MQAQCTLKSNGDIHLGERHALGHGIMAPADGDAREESTLAWLQEHNTTRIRIRYVCHSFSFYFLTKTILWWNGRVRQRFTRVFIASGKKYKEGFNNSERVALYFIAFWKLNKGIQLHNKRVNIESIALLNIK